MKRCIILILTLLSFVQVYGCGIIKKSEVKIVISEDVTSNKEQISKDDGLYTDNIEDIPSIKKNAIIKPFSKDYNSIPSEDDLRLGLEEGDYFNPLFYMEGEVYGYIYKGTDSFQEGKDGSDDNLVRKIESEPLLGIATEYLYKIDKNNKLIETDKKARYSFDGNKRGFNIENDRKLEDIYFTDTNVLKEPQRLLELIDEIKALKGEIDKETNNDSTNLDFFRVNNISGTDRYLMIERFSNQTIYLYDMVEKQFYSNVSNAENGEICYVKHLDSLLWINSDGFTIDKIILKENQFYFEEFVVLSVEEEISRVRVQALNDEEILLLHDVLMDNTTYQCTYLYKTQLVSKYNVRTNQYEYIYKSPSNEAVYYDYVGHDIYLVEKFRQEGEYIVPLVKSIQQVIDKDVRVIYEVILPGDSFANFPFERVIVNEDGTELFIAWKIYDVGVWISSEEVRYQKLKIK